jgi:hypothetical protein
MWYHMGVPGAPGFNEVQLKRSSGIISSQLVAVAESGRRWVEGDKGEDDLSGDELMLQVKHVRNFHSLLSGINGRDHTHSGAIAGRYSHQDKGCCIEIEMYIYIQ